LKRSIFELGAVISDQVTNFLFGLVFDERENFLQDVFDFGFIGEESHPDIMGEPVNGAEEILETRLRGWSDWTTKVNVNVVELLCGGAEVAEERFFVSFGHITSCAGEVFPGEVGIHFVEVFQ
jgi:hypothetical protein